MTDERTIDYAVEDGIATITLDRPARRNGFTPAMRDELIAAIDAADGDDAVRAVIVTGAGESFCVGADLSGGAKTLSIDDPEWRDSGGQVSLALYGCRKPVIAAINGHAVGVGATMTLPMDIRIASETARFGFPFVRRGIVPEACSSWFLPRVVGIAQALEWVMTGRIFGAAEALERGLVREVLPADALMARARAIAGEIAANCSGVSVAMSRQMLWRMLGADHPMAAHRVETRAIAAMGRAPDAIEGIQAFLDKRPANFSMRVSVDMPPVFPWFEDPDFMKDEE